VRSIFVASWLKARLLAHAVRVNANKGVVERAAMVMMQPPNAEPHHDHFHVRIACVPAQKAFCHDDSIAHDDRPAGLSAPSL
jgi:penicillin-insensitive murein DD-endopeptidase